MAVKSTNSTTSLSPNVAGALLLCTSSRLGSITRTIDSREKSLSPLECRAIITFVWCFVAFGSSFDHDYRIGIVKFPNYDRRTNIKFGLSS